MNGIFNKDSLMMRRTPLPTPVLPVLLGFTVLALCGGPAFSQEREITNVIEEAGVDPLRIAIPTAATSTGAAPFARELVETIRDDLEFTGYFSLQYPEDPSSADRLKNVAGSLVGLSFPFPPPRKHLSNIKWCPPIEDQLSLGSCTAQAGVGLLEYFECRTYGKHIDGSRLFLYKATRNLLNWTGDTGAFCRTTMAAMALVGVAHEKYLYNCTKLIRGDENGRRNIYQAAGTYRQYAGRISGHRFRC
jgi:hypothetical protein